MAELLRQAERAKGSTRVEVGPNQPGWVSGDDAHEWTQTRRAGCCAPVKPVTEMLWMGPHWAGVCRILQVEITFER